MKKMMLLLAAGMVSAALVACGQEAESAATVGSEAIQKSQTAGDAAGTEKPATDTKQDGSDTSASKSEENGATAENGAASETENTAGTGTTAENGQTEESKSSEEESANKFVVGDVDNFSVNGKIVARFGKEVKSIVAEQDLEALADLVAFPVYMGFADGGVSVESREDFIALGADAVFTQEMVDAMAKADENSLSASKAGFSLTETGRPNVVFGVVGGKLAIQGMNY